jgi:hypothetical protein
MVIHIGVGVAAPPVPDTVFHPRVWQYVLDACTRHSARGECVTFHGDGYFGLHGLYVQRRQLLPVQRTTENRKTAILVVVEAIAEVVLSAGVQAQFLAHARSISLQESQKATDMIVVSVADDQRVHLAAIYLHELGFMGRCQLMCKLGISGKALIGDAWQQVLILTLDPRRERHRALKRLEVNILRAARVLRFFAACKFIAGFRGSVRTCHRHRTAVVTRASRRDYSW